MCNQNNKTINAEAVPQQALIAIFSFLLLLGMAAEKDTETLMTCAFCDRSIPFGQSLCLSCMTKYNIRSYDLASDGCGCDR